MKKLFFFEQPLTVSLIVSALKLIGSLSTHDFETRTASGSELFALITRLHTITFTMLSTFSRLWMLSIKIWETPLSWHTECSLPVAVRVSKTRVLKFPNYCHITRFTIFLYMNLAFLNKGGVSVASRTLALSCTLLHCIQTIWQCHPRDKVYETLLIDGNRP